MSKQRVMLLAWLAGAAALAGGCSDAMDSVRFTYTKPAELDVLLSAAELRIGSVRGIAAGDERWARLLASHMAGELDTRRAGRVEPATARVDATVSVIASTSEAPDGVRYAQGLVACEFAIHSAEAGNKLTSLRVMRDEKRPLSAAFTDRTAGAERVGRPGAATEQAGPVEAMVARLVDRCNKTFWAKALPTEVTVRSPLAPGDRRDDAIEKGNDFARDGEYRVALLLYRQAIEADGYNDRALYNAGLMSEALVELDQAEQFYRRARRLRDAPLYVRSHKRVITLLDVEPAPAEP